MEPWCLSLFVAGEVFQNRSLNWSLMLLSLSVVVLHLPIILCIAIAIIDCLRKPPMT